MKDQTALKLAILCLTLIVLTMTVNDTNLLTHLMLYGFGYLAGKGPDQWRKA